MIWGSFTLRTSPQVLIYRKTMVQNLKKKSRALGMSNTSIATE